jgi:hypothetical protein
MIKDNETRSEIDKVKQKIARIESVQQLPDTATLKEVIDAVNKITKSLKRR